MNDCCIIGDVAAAGKDITFTHGITYPQLKINKQASEKTGLESFMTMASMPTYIVS